MTEAERIAVLIESRRAMDGQPYMGRTFSFAEWYGGFLAGRGPRWQLPMFTQEPTKRSARHRAETGQTA